MIVFLNKHESCSYHKIERVLWMPESSITKCENCGCEISVNESYFHNGITLCDDCYLENIHRVMACNPLVIYSAKRFQDADGLKPEDRLNEEQKTIYNYIKSREKVTVRELINKFNITLLELENQLAILRHLELTKKRMENNKIYIIPF